MNAHNFIIRHKNIFKQQFPSGGIIIEIGGYRETKGQQSSSALAQICQEIKWHFISVDVDKNVTEKTKEIIEKINPTFQTYNMKGEDFLKNYNGAITVIYLDAFDLLVNPERQKNLAVKYKEMGLELSNENCHKMHYECAVYLSKKMLKGRYIVFDDVKSGPPNWDGKGKLAIPYLLENGFELIKMDYNGCLMKKK